MEIMDIAFRFWMALAEYYAGNIRNDIRRGG